MPFGPPYGVFACWLCLRFCACCISCKGLFTLGKSRGWHGVENRQRFTLENSQPCANPEIAFNPGWSQPYSGAGLRFSNLGRHQRVEFAPGWACIARSVGKCWVQRSHRHDRARAFCVYWVQGTNSSPVESSAKSTKFGTPSQAAEVSEASQTKNNKLYDLSDPVLFSNFSRLAD